MPNPFSMDELTEREILRMVYTRLEELAEDMRMSQKSTDLAISRLDMKITTIGDRVDAVEEFRSQVSGGLKMLGWLLVPIIVALVTWAIATSTNGGGI